MKSINFYCSILLVFSLVSCQPRNTTNKTILRAEAVLFSSPDSSYRLLTSISHPEKLSKPDNAAWCLQFTHTQIRLHKDVKSDSLIMIPVNYYKNIKLVKQTGTAYYLLGYIKRKLRRNKEAMEAFKQADFYFQNTEENKLKGLVNYYLGDICMEDETYNYALQYFKKALNYFRLSHDKNYQAYAYREISNMYHLQDYELDSVMLYSDLALKLSKETGDSINYNYILARQGEFLYNTDFKVSNQYVHQGFRFFPDQRSYYAAYLSYTYSMLNKPDSAKFYLNISLSDASNTKTKVISYLAGAYIQKKEGNQKKAFEYFEKAFVYRDSVFKQSIRSQLYRIDKQYDLTKKEEENTALKINNQNKVIVIGLLVIIVLVGLVIFLIIYNRYKKRQAQHTLEKQQMEYAIQVEKTENNQKRELLLSKLHSRIENTLHLNQLKMGLSQPERLNDFIKEISAQSILPDTDWQYYIDEVNQIFDKKISNLTETNALLTQPDIIVITLICLGLDISDSCNLLNMNKNAMYHRRKIIKERIGIPKNTDLEQWITDYLAS